MELPSMRRVVLLGWRALRLRCPNCGAAPVMTALRSWRDWGTVRSRCAACNFRFERSDDHYFSGAMITNLFLSELLFAIGFCTTVVLLWPNVPWDTLTWVAAVGMLLAPAVLYPFSKVLWLTIDVLVRPTMPEELT
jgi:uncharacterized protein (DUF983 family)